MKHLATFAIALALFAGPLAVDAQLKTPVRIGFLPLGSPSNAYDRSLVEAFRQGLREVGVVEGRDVALDVVWISSEPDASQAVNGLIQRGARLLIPAGSTASMAVKRQTSTIPILFVSVGNPVGMGLVESLSRPNSNATGFADVLSDLSGKYVELARELTKPHTTIDYLWHTGWPDGQPRRLATERAAQSLGVKLRSTRDRRRRRSQRCPGWNKEERSGDAHCSAEPVYLSETRSAHRVRDELSPGDDIRFPTSCKGRRIDRV